MTTFLDDLREAGIEPMSFDGAGPVGADGTDIRRIEDEIRQALTGRRPHPWRGYDTRLSRVDRYDLDTRILRLGFPPVYVPRPSDAEADAGLTQEGAEHQVGPVWCDYGPEYPDGFVGANVRRGDALWVHTPWGTFPAWTNRQAAELVVGASLLANLPIVDLIQKSGNPKPIWPYMQTTIIPDQQPGGMEIKRVLEEHWNEE